MATGTIDIHHHILPPDYLAALGSRLGPQGLFGSPPHWSPATSIETMDRHGIRTAITSISAPGVWFGDAAEARLLSRQCNEYAANVKRDFPGRFGFFAILPLPDIDAGLREIQYALDTLDADGVVLMTNYEGCYPGDKAFSPIFQELNRRKAIAFFHPNAGPYENPLPHIPIPSLEFPFETTRAVTSLLYSGVLSRSRDIRFIFSHAGGTVPYLAQRIGRLTARPEFREAVPDGVLAELGRLYFDTALSASHFAFDAMRRLVPASQILFGSDYPHAGEATLVATLEGLHEVAANADEIAAIKMGNAKALMPHFAAA